MSSLPMYTVRCATVGDDPREAPVSCFQRSSPVAASTAHRYQPLLPMYTVPSTTAGVDQAGLPSSRFRRVPPVATFTANRQLLPPM